MEDFYYIDRDIFKKEFLYPSQCYFYCNLEKKQKIIINITNI